LFACRGPLKQSFDSLLVSTPLAAASCVRIPASFNSARFAFEAVLLAQGYTRSILTVPALARYNQCRPSGAPSEYSSRSPFLAVVFTRPYPCRSSSLSPAPQHGVSTRSPSATSQIRVMPVSPVPTAPVIFSVVFLVALRVCPGGLLELHKKRASNVSSPHA